MGDLRRKRRRSEARNGRNMQDLNLLNEKRLITVNYERVRRGINRARSLGSSQSQGQLNDNINEEEVSQEALMAAHHLCAQ